MTRSEWLALAKKRLISVLQKRTVATDRTLEQKISDAGPHNQRVEPKILTQARRNLVDQGRISVLNRSRTPWFYLAETPFEEVEARRRPPGRIRPIWSGQTASLDYMYLEVAWGVVGFEAVGTKFRFAFA